MDLPQDLVERRILRIALDRLTDEPVILLEGPRAVGRSTALRALADHLNGVLLDLDDLATRDAALTDPTTMIASSGLTCIDEYQHAPGPTRRVRRRRSTLPTGAARPWSQSHGPSLHHTLGDSQTRPVGRSALVARSTESPVTYDGPATGSPANRAMNSGRPRAASAASRSRPTIAFTSADAAAT